MITTQFIDMDLSVVPATEGAGLVEPDADAMMRMSSVESFEAARPGMMIPRTEWKDRSQQLLQQYRDDITEIYSQGNFGSCFPAGTFIRMADGTQKPIERIRLLDKVLTAEGNIGEVTQLFVRDAKELCVLDVWGHRHLKMTDEHPVLTKRGYVKASEIVADDFIAIPRYLPCNNLVIQTANYFESERVCIAARQVRSKRSSSVSGRTTAVMNRSAVPDLIQLNAAAGRIIGLFLAEGNTERYRVTWTFNANERDTLVAELISLLRDEWGVTARLQMRRKTTVKVIIDSHHWAMFFESLCGTGSGEKRLHPDIAAGPLEFMESMLSAWLDGDGYERRGYRQGVTVSHELALNMYDIAQALGYMPSISTVQPKTCPGVRFRRRRWDVVMNAESAKDYHCREQNKKHVWRRVRSVTREPYSGHVYNFEVQGDNSYVAEGIGVHNCVGFGSAQMLEVTLRRRYGKKFRVSLSGMSIYKRIGRSPNSGAMVADGMDAVIEGALPTDTPENKAVYAHTHPLRSWQSLPTGWQDTAKLFRGSKFVVARGADEIASALLNGFCGIVGRSGHCIPYCFLDFNGNSPVAAYANSWGSDWSDHGFGYDSERTFGSLSCWILLDVATRPDLQVPESP